MQGEVDPRVRGGDDHEWSRRQFLGAVGTAVAGTALGAAALARAAGAQPQRQMPLAREGPDGTATPGDSAGAPPAPNAAAGAGGTPSPASNVAMDPSGYKPVGLPPKAGARPTVTAEQRAALEHRRKCPCPCKRAVYPGRTPDCTCGISPAMHADVQQLVAGGYSGDEILAAFTGTYGERVLMSPPRKGFNLAGYFAPFAVLGTGTVVVGSLMRRWSTRAQAAIAARAPVAQPAPVSTARADRGDPVSYTAADAATLDATPAELARLEAAVRGEPA